MKVSVVKYWVIFLTQLKNLFEYRITIILKILRPLIIAFGVSSLWWVIFDITGKKEIAGFTLSSFIFYLLIVRFVASINPGHSTIEEINEEVRTGRIAIRVVRPMNYLIWLFARALPVPLFSGIVGMLIATLFAVYFNVHIPQNLILVLFLFSMIATILVYYAFYLLIGILSFWFYEVFAFERLFKQFLFLLSGEFIPLTLFGGYQSILQFTPFAGLAFVPAGIYIGLFDINLIFKLVLVQYFWAVLLWVFLVFLYRKGLKAFESQGG